MPATLTNAGLATQPLVDILAEIRADLLDPVVGFGPLHDVTSATSPVSILAAFHARWSGDALVIDGDGLIHVAGGTTYDDSSGAAWFARLDASGATQDANLTLKVDLSTWGSILILIVLAEVFREGARLKEEQELTI